ncbi:hypothetical protein ACFLRB_04215 [Acidobacteriota bacterium]
MKKTLCATLIIIFLLSVLPVVLNGQGLEQLTEKTFNSIAGFFNDKYNVSTSIIKFENFSGFSDILAQKYYQLLVAKFESKKNVVFNDLMINFSRNRGKFNLLRIGKLNYLIYIKLIRNREKLGAGTVIFSKSLDRIVHIRYVKETLTTGERDIINTVDYGFKTVGFSKVIEFEAKKNLLDFKTIRESGGEERFFFYYPGEIEIYKMAGSQFRKFFSFKLKWRRPYYPVIQPEGKLSCFYRDSKLYLTAGSNFSTRSKIFEFADNQWREVDSVNFVPFKLIRINNGEYLAGASYKEGKNFFEGKILLTPFRSGKLRTEETYEKSLPLFYSIAFSVNEDNLDSIHVIDREYRYRYFASDFEEWTGENERRGAALCALRGKWLAISDYSETVDTLYFYKIDINRRELVFENKVNGEVIFIAEGSWKKKDGFWVYVKAAVGKAISNAEYRLQFWSKNDG